ncbi:MAG: TonB C-terminal domain-containing protein, partial [Chloroflexi bacterium]|nr:TonB C-terminal domain-containing protein [Chloroflexota bacterium]
NGSVSDIEILKGSGVPPYDFAAKHALELASPLKALPADFPKKSERVTAMFYYNMEIPNG